MNSKYDFESTESGKYERWINKGYFKCDPKSEKKPFCIVLPPPNVTGVLHLGHAWDAALQDIKRCKVMILYGYLVWIMQQLLQKQK